MWESYTGLKVKVVYKDGDNIRAYTGVFRNEDDTFIFVGDEDKPLSFNKSIVHKVDPK